MLFKQLLAADAIDVCQIDSCRLAGINEILAVLLMAAKKGVPVCPHAGGVGLTNYVVHCASPPLPRRPSQAATIANESSRWRLLPLAVSIIDYLCVSGTKERNVLECVGLSLPRPPRRRTSSRLSLFHRYVSHLHEHFEHPPTINERGFYNVRPPSLALSSSQTRA